MVVKDAPVSCLTDWSHMACLDLREKETYRTPGGIHPYLFPRIDNVQCRHFTSIDKSLDPVNRYREQVWHIVHTYIQYEIGEIIAFGPRAMRSRM